MSAVTVIGFISIIIAFIALVVAAYKGVTIMLVAPLCALFVAICNGLPILDTFTNAYMGSFIGFVQNLFLVFLLAIMLGRFYMDSGAGITIAHTLMRVFGKDTTGHKRQAVAVFVCAIVGFLLAYGGIDTFCCLFTMFPIVLSLCKETNIPRRFLFGILNIGICAAATAPGAALQQNYISMSVLGTSAFAGLIPGIVAAIIVFVGGSLMSIRMIGRASANGEVFSYGRIAIPAEKPEDKNPSFLLSVLPIIGVIVVFFVTGTLLYALFTGLVIAALALSRYFTPAEGKTLARTVLDSLAEGGKSAAEAVCLAAVVVGFAGVVQATDCFNVIIDWLVKLPLHPLVIVMLSIAVVVMLCGSPPATLLIMLPVLAAAFPALSVNALHRVAAVTTLTFDTLPFQGAVIVLLALCDTSFKDGYKPVFVTTVMWTGIAAIVSAILFILFPGLA